MADGSVPVAQGRGDRTLAASRWLGWGLVAAVGLYFYLTEVAQFVHFDAAHYTSFWTTRWWLVAHLGGGSLALVLGPFQFSGALRRRFVKAHRWMGRLYLFGVLVASLAAIYMGLYVGSSRAFGVSLLYLDLAWVVTTGLAYVAVMRRQFAAHREWMIRSYVVTFAFVVFRLLMRFNVFGSLGIEPQLVMAVWVAWAVPLLVTEVVLRWRQTIGVRKLAPDVR